MLLLTSLMQITARRSGSTVAWTELGVTGVLQSCAVAANRAKRIVVDESVRDCWPGGL
jgi:hypothetical protein